MSDIGEMIKLAKAQGFIDYVDFKKYLPKEITSQEQIADIVELLEDMDIEVRFKAAAVLTFNLAARKTDTKFVINDDIWRIFDPDEVLKLSPGDINTTSARFLEQIQPREDLIQLVHSTSNIIVDLGYYGSEADLDGSWVAKVIDSNIDDAWEHPMEQQTFSYSEFESAIKHIEKLVAKYT